MIRHFSRDRMILFGKIGEKYPFITENKTDYRTRWKIWLEISLAVFYFYMSSTVRTSQILTSMQKEFIRFIFLAILFVHSQYKLQCFMDIDIGLF